MGAIEACRTAALGGHVAPLRRLRPHRDRLQLLPQSSLPQVPGRGAGSLAGRAAGGAAAGSLFPRRLHPAGAGRRRSPSRTRRRSTPSCSAPPPRRCASSRPTRATSAPRSAASPCCTPGARRCSTIRMSTASCRAAASRPTARAGSPAGPGFFLSVQGARPRCSGGSFSNGSPPPSPTAELRFFGDLAPLAEPRAFAAHCAALRRIDWVVYAKPPFGGPEQVLAYLGRYTHRVAIANSRLVAMTDGAVSFLWKDYRQEGRRKVMTLDAGRVHAPLPPARPALRLPSHPPLRLPRQWPSRSQARALPTAARAAPAPIAGRAAGRLSRALSSADRMLARNLPVLRRPDDVPGRSGAPRAAKLAALARHLMTDLARSPTGSLTTPTLPDRVGKPDRYAARRPERRRMRFNRCRSLHPFACSEPSLAHRTDPRCRPAAAPAQVACRPTPAVRTIPIAQRS